MKGRRLLLGALVAVSAWVIGNTRTTFDTSPETGVTIPGNVTGAEIWLHERLMRVVSRYPDGPNAFTTDGCSGGMTEAWKSMSAIAPGFVESYGDRPPWEDCCIAHDHAYHAAGGATDALRSTSARLVADEALRACVLDVGKAEQQNWPENAIVPLEQADLAYAALSDAMFHAVRLGGFPCSGLPWRWGYGFPNCDGVTTAP
ncbi:hypothetical protein [Qingshengfaniella alkalisoli]|uniref:Uncharacterized protein n=1 Tax=Qingshengfaniella alkalisoli TaxID=2599296 RepID=A0A5B8I529_9RHOB|nr:hypothetical protein [Qingshengfaniella alkalisoli]QDY68335.1 hypothetical protein FPZ52_00995 [Qingshengfaniella alkalisoli]